MNLNVAKSRMTQVVLTVLLSCAMTGGFLDSPRTAGWETTKAAKLPLFDDCGRVHGQEEASTMRVVQIFTNGVVNEVIDSSWARMNCVIVSRLSVGTDGNLTPDEWLIGIEHSRELICDMDASMDMKMIRKYPRVVFEKYDLAITSPTETICDCLEHTKGGIVGLSDRAGVDGFFGDHMTCVWLLLRILEVRMKNHITVHF